MALGPGGFRWEALDAWSRPAPAAHLRWGRERVLLFSRGGVRFRRFLNGKLLVQRFVVEVRRFFFVFVDEFVFADFAVVSIGDHSVIGWFDFVFVF